MPDAKTIEAATTCLGAFKSLLLSLGPVWSCTLAAVIGLVVWLITHYRTRQLEKGWEKALEAKDAMIKQINQQNRELRVQSFVVGGRFSQEEAMRLVYQEDPAEAKQGEGGK